MSWLSRWPGSVAASGAWLCVLVTLAVGWTSDRDKRPLYSNGRWQCLI